MHGTDRHTATDVILAAAADPHAEARRLGLPFFVEGTRIDVPWGWTGVVRHLARTLAAHVPDEGRNPLLVAAVSRSGPELLTYLAGGGPVARRIAVRVAEEARHSAAHLDPDTGVPTPDGTKALRDALRDDVLAEDRRLDHALLDEVGPDGRTGWARLAALERDLAGLDRRNRGAPSRADLARAPHLELWQLVFRPGDTAVTLQGVVTSHPHIADGRRAATSPVYALDGERAWARTASRYYSLGMPGPAPASPTAREAVERT